MRKLMVLRCQAALVVVVAVTLSGAQARPDLVLVNGRVFTGISTRPWAEALAIRGERVAAVGPSADIREMAGPSTRVVDLGNRLVVPGFNDAHAHPGAMPAAVQLEGPPAVAHDPTLDEILGRLKAAAARAPAPGWIFGEIGAAVLDDPGATRFALDRVTSEHLVMLTSWTGHGTLFNSAALRRLGVREDEADPPGGFYRRMPGSRTVSGMAHEYAEYRLRQRVSLEPDAASQLAAFRHFTAEAASLGITSVQAMMTSLPAFEAARMLANVDLPIRLRLIDFPMGDISAWRPPSRRSASSPRVTVSGTKWVLDGTPIERLMLLREPFADAPSRGRLNYATADLTRAFQRVRAAGDQPMVHAVGDAAIDAVLDALEASGGEAWRRLRPRIEHGDLLQPDQFARARRLGVIVVQNPSHFMIPEVMAARLGPARAARNQPVKSALAAGIPLALGSDGPLSPFLNLMFAVTHANNPAEALTLEQAVAAYTQGAAFAEFMEKDKGTIAAGMLADVAVLSQDIFKVPADAWPRTTSALTIVGGRIVHEAR